MALPDATSRSLQFEARHPWHLYICDQASSPAQIIGLRKLSPEENVFTEKPSDLIRFDTPSLTGYHHHRQSQSQSSPHAHFLNYKKDTPISRRSQSHVCRISPVHGVTSSIS